MNPLDVETAVSIFDRVCARQPEREAIVYRGRRVTYGELKERADQLAGGLLELGVRRGDKVGLLMANCPEWICAKLAVLKTGAVLVPLNTRFKTHELEYILGQSDATALIVQDQYLGIDYVPMIGQICPELPASRPGELRSAKLPLLRRVIVLGEQAYPGTFAFEDVLRAGAATPDDGRLAAAQAAIQHADLANILYTSGTTGFPKGAMLSHRNMVYDAEYTIKRLGLNPDDRVVCPLPFFHIFGCWVEVFFTLYHGGCVVILDRFEAEDTLRTIQDERCTVLYGVPTVYVSLLDHPNFAQYDTKSLRAGLMGASAVPEKLMIDVIEKMGVRGICQSYGMSEDGLTSCTLPGDPPHVHASSIGVPIECLEYKIVDPSTGEELPVGREGELCHRGPIVTPGYYRKPEETAKAIDADGWLHSGDLAVKDERGYYRITGRAKDIFIVGGENVAPAEVESFLFRHPKIKQAYVVGVPDQRLGDVGMAFIELKEGEAATEQEIVDYCRGKIANFKIPRHVRFVREFPTTASGKIQKFKLRELGVAQLGLS